MNILDQLERYQPFNSQEERDKELFIKYIKTFDNYLLRDNEFGHVCSSAYVLNRERTKILMIHHNIYNAWGWLGGHADGDSDLLHVAIKEVKEESNLAEITPISNEIFTIDSLSVAGHMKNGKYVSAHTHLNFAFILEADEKESISMNKEENSGVKWVEIDQMVEISDEPHMRSAYHKAIQKMRALNIIK